jgi:hypothetical protein
MAPLRVSTHLTLFGSITDLSTSSGTTLLNGLPKDAPLLVSAYLPTRMVTLILSRQARDSVPPLFEPRIAAGHLLLSAFLQRFAIRRHCFLQPRRPTLASAQLRKSVAEVVLRPRPGRGRIRPAATREDPLDRHQPPVPRPRISLLVSVLVQRGGTTIEIANAELNFVDSHDFCGGLEVLGGLQII